MDVVGDEGVPSSQRQEGAAAEAGIRGGVGGGEAVPMPPIFGNANAGTAADMDFKGINLDDVFSGVFFSPDGELLDIPSDEEACVPSLTLSSGPAAAGGGGGHPQFAQFAVIDRSGGDGMSTETSTTESVKREQPQVAVGVDMSAITAQTGTSGGVTETAMPVDAGRVAMAEAAAAAAAAAEEARAAQERAIAKAAEAVKAAAAHAEAQARIQHEGSNTVDAPPHATPAAATGTTAALPSPPSGGAASFPGQAATSAVAAAVGTSARPAGGGFGFGGSTSGSTPQGIRMGTPAAGAPGFRSLGGGIGSRRTSSGGGAAPRRQRHKVSSKDLTEEQRIERRERNREHAKRSRVRKKFLLDSLQRSVDALQAENDCLKDSIIHSLGDRGRVLVSKCVPEDVGGLVTANPTQATKILDDPDYSLVKALQTAQQNFVITDASLPDNPIVFASGGFLELTGYKLSEVLGRNCRFLQGPETDPRAVDKIRKAIEEGADTSVCLLNYRADATTFWNQFFVAALRDSGGTTVNYVGVQCKVGDDYARIVVSEQNRQLATPSTERGDSIAAPAPARAKLTPATTTVTPAR